MKRTGMAENQVENTSNYGKEQQKTQRKKPMLLEKSTTKR